MSNSTFALVVWIMMLALGCNNSDQVSGPGDQSQEIVNRAISAMGGEILDRALITFDFRDQSLSYYNDGGQFRYTRTFPDTAGNVITDTLTNEDFIRYRNGEKLDLSEEQKSSLKGGVNSIIYFAFLPYKLNDPGVRKEYLGSVAIAGKTYEKVKVDFPENEATDAYNDIYFYYFDPEDYSLDYLSYEFEEDGGGIRFRSAYNARKIDGLIVQDYINYMADPDSVDYARIETYFDQGLLRELSRIELKNIKIYPLN